MAKIQITKIQVLRKHIVIIILSFQTTCIYLNSQIVYIWIIESFKTSYFNHVLAFNTLNILAVIVLFKFKDMCP